VDDLHRRAPCEDPRTLFSDVEHLVDTSGRFLHLLRNTYRVVERYSKCVAMYRYINELRPASEQFISSRKRIHRRRDCTSESSSIPLLSSRRIAAGQSAKGRESIVSVGRYRTRSERDSRRNRSASCRRLMAASQARSCPSFRARQEWSARRTSSTHSSTTSSSQSSAQPPRRLGAMVRRRCEIGRASCRGMEELL